MKLSELISNIEVTGSMQDVLSDISSELIVAKLKESRGWMIGYYEDIMKGVKYHNVFEFNDPEEDARQIARRIEAYDLILSEYTYGHEPYRFKDVTPDATVGDRQPEWGGLQNG